MRKRLKRYLLVALGTVLIVEGAVAIATMPRTLKGQNAWVEFNKQAFQEKQNPIRVTKWLSYELPHITKYKFNINQTSEEDLAKALENEETKKSMEEMIKEDEKNQLTEIGGIVTYIEEEKRLNFYTIESSNYKHAAQLQNGLKNNDPSLIERFFEKNWEEMKFFAGKKEDRLSEYLSSYKKISKEELLKNLAKDYISLSDSNYLTYPEEFISFYHKNFLKIKGKYVGTFHIHIDGEGPGGADLGGSELEREMVIVKIKNGIKVYDLVHQKSTPLN